MTEFYKVTGEKMRRYQKIRNVLLTVIVTLALQCTFEVCLGGYVDSNLVNGLNKLCGAFTVLDYTDLLTAAAVFVMLKEVKKREAKTDVATLVLSVILSFLLIVCISFKKYDSAIFLWGNSFQILLSTFCVLGFAVLLYLVLRLVYFGLEHVELPAEQGKKHLQMVGFFVIAFSWLFWILLNYPGTTSGDGLVQLKQFLGEQDWGAAHPPFSSAIMGICFVLGRTIADANFGFFLYCLMQTLVGAYAFSLSMKKLQELGISWKWCAVGILFFALTPFWGTYAQWFEKDLLYAEMTVLQAVYLMSVLKKKECGGKDAAGLIVFSVLSCLLRNNGIYAIVPALLLLAIYLKGKERRKAFLVLLATVVIYELITVVGYRALIDVGKPAASEGLSVPFQQTARYVCEYEDEVTEYERQVINDTLNFDAMKNYEPRISDPIKILYRGGDLGPYMKIWVQMFFKHPGCYVAAFVNKGYGYLAPVEQNIEAWIQLEYPEYAQEQGIHHTFPIQTSEFLLQIWFLSMRLPLIKYLCTPGLYTWILVVLAFFLWKKKRYSALILLVPGFINVLVCLASPMSNAIRYELPTVAVIPLLVGWTVYSVHTTSRQTGEE